MGASDVMEALWRSSQSIDVCSRSTGLRDLNLDAMEADGPRCCIGPARLLPWLLLLLARCRGCKALF